jgi:biotin carboxylase
LVFWEIYFRKSFKMEFTTNDLDIKNAVIIVDTYSSGALLADTIFKLGYKVIRVFSQDLKELLDMIPDGLNYSFIATFIFDDTIPKSEAVQKIINEVSLLNIPIDAIIAGAETGVELADQLSETMNLRTNGTIFSEARRNKFVMGETVRTNGIRSVTQLLATTWDEVSDWLETWTPDPYKLIVKPVDSAGSDGVTLCVNANEVKTAFDSIFGKVNGLGKINTAVLVQEYLEGLEYVVDIVSRDGKHKVVAVWVYDRRESNGAGFVLYGQRLLTTLNPRCKAIAEYQKLVIDALGIKNGPTHGEVKWFKNEPVLVEVGARLHGGEGLWKIIEDESNGYNQVQVTIDSYLNEQNFYAVPDEVIFI